MAKPPTPKTLKVPAVEPIPYVVIKLPSGKRVLRHPDEISKR